MKSPFKHALAARDAHITTLRLALGIMSVMLLASGYGWYRAPESLTIHIPPDLRHGSTRPWWEVPAGDVYTFAFYIFQQLNRWPENGEQDYQHNITRLRAYLTPSCQAKLNLDWQQRRDRGELRERVRGIYEIPGRGYKPDRVQVLSRDSWTVMLDLSVDEYFQNEPVKRALVRYPVNIVRQDIDPEKNPWGLALDCFASTPQKLEAVKPEATP
ncbi:PFL_4703 family integrating conjugative element protein [Citrobacter portucalensis]|uniref:PFL_4703 family integrating conjugative element protein n=1 Tax=Citrobacter portucalensis TaxID=1639133 RepID=UPI00226B86E5|nr:TIGR03746 family integrating conjugative element protein [Citrobacter portucalensis]MCX8984251.1 TIGR03746 family integrating conjugative element protein [Citrobacter portucalensis]